MMFLPIWAYSAAYFICVFADENRFLSSKNGIDRNWWIFGANYDNAYYPIPTYPYPSYPYPSNPYPSYPYPSNPYPSYPYSSYPYPSYPFSQRLHFSKKKRASKKRRYVPRILIRAKALTSAATAESSKTPEMILEPISPEVIEYIEILMKECKRNEGAVECITKDLMKKCKQVEEQDEKAKGGCELCLKSEEHKSEDGGKSVSTDSTPFVSKVSILSCLSFNIKTSIKTIRGGNTRK